jgi:catechol 2,3-dioxygenase-like lactoylglutathione lyase family enzyme
MESILDHVSLSVTDFTRSKAFYSQALGPLGITLLMEFGLAAGFGRARPELWLAGAKSEFQTDEQLEVLTPIHVCLRARSRVEVDAFHAAAIAARGRDNGAPGIRAHYHPNYYAAFALDLDGHNVEAVFHE